MFCSNNNLVVGNKNIDMESVSKLRHVVIALCMSVFVLVYINMGFDVLNAYYVYLMLIFFYYVDGFYNICMSLCVRKLHCFPRKNFVIYLCIILVYYYFYL